MGLIVYKLMKFYGIYVDCYIVSNGQLHPEKLNNIDIYELDQASEVISKDTPIILALNKSYHTEVKQVLRKNGFKQIIDTMVEDQIIFLRDIYRPIIEQSGCVIQNGILSKENYRQIDPFSDRRLESFFLEAGDLFLPGVCKNDNWYTEGPYEIDNVIVESEDVVIDCGANIGIFSCYASSKGASKVYSFEPFPDVWDVLETHRKMYLGVMNVEHYALSDCNGKIDMCVSEVSDGEGSIVFNHMIGKKIEVNKITIDSYVKSHNIQRIDFIKADIEGAERQMLRGARWVLNNMQPKLSICTYHLPDDKEVLENLIIEANPNYVIEHRHKKLYAYVPKK